METFNEFDQPGTAPQKNFSDIISHSFNIYMKYLGWSILLLFLLFCVSMLLSSLLNVLVGYNALEAQAEMQDIIKDEGFGSDLFVKMMGVPGYSASLGVSIILSILLYPTYAGFINIMHKSNIGDSVNFSDLFVGYKKNTVQFIIFGVISGIVSFIGLLLCGIGIFFVIPFIYLGLSFILFENQSAVEATSNSFNIAKSNYGTLLGVSAISLLISFSGVILCGIGILATAPFFYGAMYSVYCAYRGVPKSVIN